MDNQEEEEAPPSSPSPPPPSSQEHPSPQPSPGSPGGDLPHCAATGSRSAPGASLPVVQPPSGETSELLTNRAVLRVALEKFYREFNPANASRVHEFLERYKGREAQLVRDIEEKYKDKKVQLINYAPPPTSPPQLPQARPDIQGSVAREDVGIAAIPAMILSAFAKTNAHQGSGHRPRSSSATTPSRQAASRSAATSCQDPSQATALPPPSPPPPLPHLNAVIAEKEALARERAVLSSQLKALQARLDTQASEVSALERRLKDSVRQGEALQRNLLTVMEKELAMHKKNEELKQGIAVAETRAAAAERERKEATSARDVCDEQLRTTIAFQHLLTSQLHSLIRETNVDFDPYHESPEQPGPESTSSHQPEDNFRLKTSLAASRVELALVLRSRTELEERLESLHKEKKGLEEVVADLQMRLAEDEERSAKLTGGLEAAQREVADRVKTIEDYESALAGERRSRAEVEAELEEAKAVIRAAAKTRKEVDAFCRQFRVDVEAAASERVNQALSLSAMCLEDMLSRQPKLLDLQRQLQETEIQCYKDEIIRLSRSLFESRRDYAYSEKQIDSLKQELHKGAEELVQLKEKMCMGAIPAGQPSLS